VLRPLITTAVTLANVVILATEPLSVQSRAPGANVEAQLAVADEPSLAQVLVRAAGYTRRLHAQLSAIVAEEAYRQELRTTLDSSIRPFSRPRRALRSDLLLVNAAPEQRYVEFRDVFEVDGVPVRDRSDRLTALFLEPLEKRRSRLAAIIAESARYNIGDIPRNINTPLLTLSFLLPESQSRFRFRRVQPWEPRLVATAMDHLAESAIFRVTTEMWVVEFRETRRPTVIRTNERGDFPASGRFWLDPDTGAVLMSELQMDNQKINATINVSYQSEPLLGFLVPLEMRERYQVPGVVVDGRASYGKFRQFQVRTEERIVKPSSPPL
jgi:hypothetical protein